MAQDYAALILAGGGGTRLWPLSLPEHPKPFLRDFPRRGPSLIEQTISRLEGLIDQGSIYIVVSAQHLDALRSVLPGWDSARLIVEPAARNTAAAIAYGLCWVAEHHGQRPTWAVLPADHRVRAPNSFRTSLNRALQDAQHGRRLLTLGITPSFPSSDYGYIRVDPASESPVRQGLGFTEKPDRTRAQAWIASGDHLWNAGIFVAAHERFEAALLEHCPEILNAARACATKQPNALAAFAQLQSLPFDRAVMEKLERFGVVELDAGWSDVGQWQRAAQELPRDSQRNAWVSGVGARTQLVQSEDCSVWNRDAEVAIIGARDLCVVVHQGRVLVVGKGHEDKVAQMVASFSAPERRNRGEDEP